MAIASCYGTPITLHSYATPFSSAGSITCLCSNNRSTSLSTERLREPPNSLRSPCWSISSLRFDQLPLKFGLELLFAPAEYSKRMEQRLRFTCQLPKSNYMELSRMRQEEASHHGYEDRQHFNQTAYIFFLIFIILI